MNELLLAFIPIFFAMDPVGLLPIFAGLTQGLSADSKRRIIGQSLITATAVAVGFIFLGRFIFHVLGIGMGDFMVAGGVILFILSMQDLTGHRSTSPSLDDVGAVPIGTPLIVGPAVLTMCLISMNEHGLGLTLAAVLLNVLIVGILFIFADFFINFVGPSGSRAISKVLSLLLAAIGVMMVRRGIIEIISTFRV